ncbi:hypothetical protein EV281_10812 [Rhizobium sp. BK418]|nr:hypothetical protein EV281_10812 [Rhizobium sp. BK418]
MGGSDALLSIEESIPLVVDMVDANRSKPDLRYVDCFYATLPWGGDLGRNIDGAICRHRGSGKSGRVIAFSGRRTIVCIQINFKI